MTTFAAIASSAEAYLKCSTAIRSQNHCKPMSAFRVRPGSVFVRMRQMEVHLCPASLVDGDLASNTARMFAVGFAPAMQVLRPSEFATPMRRANESSSFGEEENHRTAHSSKRGLLRSDTAPRPCGILGLHTQYHVRLLCSRDVKLVHNIVAIPHDCE